MSQKSSTSPTRMPAEKLVRDVRRRRIYYQALSRHTARQRQPKIAAHVADEPLDLALALRAIRAAEPRAEAAMPREIKKASMKAVLPMAIAVTFLHHSAHIVVQHFPRHATKYQKACSWQESSVSSEPPRVCRRLICLSYAAMAG